MQQKNKKRLEWAYGTAGLLGALATIPQVIKVWTIHPDHLAGLSLITWLSYGLICVLGIVYAISFQRKAILLTNIAYAFLYGAIVTGMLIEAKSFW